MKEESKEENIDIERARYLERAKYWLDRVRRESKLISGAKLIDDKIRWVKEYTAKAGLSLEDIGTSEKELQELEREAYKNEARYWLEILRKEAEEYEGVDYCHIDFILSFCRKAKITLEEIGSSEEELEKFKNFPRKDWILNTKQLLPVSVVKEKRYKGKVIYYRSFQMYRSQWAEPWDESYGKWFPEIDEKGNIPLCCKEYLELMTAEKYTRFEMVDTICKCGNHWVYLTPAGRLDPYARMKIFQIIETFK